MKQTGSKTARIVPVLLLVLIAFSPSRAEDIKSRMLKRLPEIKELKLAGVIGENNRGYLEFVPGGKEHRKENQALVSAENNDRREVYSRIAAQHNTPLQVVEKHRAAQIEQNAMQGEWLQDAGGKWYQKK